MKQFTTHDIARICAVTIPGVIRWIEEGKLKAYKTPGGHRRILAPDFLDFLKRYQMPIPLEVEGWNKKRVLVVDDDAPVRQVLKRIISRIGSDIEIQEAADGFEAGHKLILPPNRSRSVKWKKKSGGCLDE
ncbi:MAG: helix-turn-helix domain-containing protein [Elusimicrobia bacterium]|nr:helix-turn-helix domain-containing protein [Elusimicrobiota bacterium]